MTDARKVAEVLQPILAPEAPIQDCRAILERLCKELQRRAARLQDLAAAAQGDGPPAAGRNPRALRRTLSSEVTDDQTHEVALEICNSVATCCDEISDLERLQRSMGDREGLTAEVAARILTGSLRLSLDEDQRVRVSAKYRADAGVDKEETEAQLRDQLSSARLLVIDSEPARQLDGGASQRQQRNALLQPFVQIVSAGLAISELIDALRRAGHMQYRTVDMEVRYLRTTLLSSRSPLSSPGTGGAGSHPLKTLPYSWPTAGHFRRGPF